LEPVGADVADDLELRGLFEPVEEDLRDPEPGATPRELVELDAIRRDVGDDECVER